MKNFDWYFDPPEDETVIAVKCKKCGRFVKTAGIVNETDDDGNWIDSYVTYECSVHGRIPERDTTVICA